MRKKNVQIHVIFCHVWQQEWFLCFPTFLHYQTFLYYPTFPLGQVVPHSYIVPDPYIVMHSYTTLSHIPTSCTLSHIPTLSHISTLSHKPDFRYIMYTVTEFPNPIRNLASNYRGCTRDTWKHSWTFLCLQLHDIILLGPLFCPLEPGHMTAGRFSLWPRAAQRIMFPAQYFVFKHHTCRRHFPPKFILPRRAKYLSLDGSPICLIRLASAAALRTDWLIHFAVTPHRGKVDIRCDQDRGRR